MTTQSTDELRVQRTVSSMLWAAWGDALGFISELTDAAGLRRRLDGQALEEPVSWTRRVGGRFGVNMTLPAGCYSDDTQLRLAAARAISGRGFDVEAFARVELPVWPTYALGGGRASKAAAANLARPNTPWFVNRYEGWLDAGGNGAAMRIQPHVWAARNPAVVGPHLLDVVVDAVSTHGHPRALVGAVLYASALGVTMMSGNVPGESTWSDLLHMTEQTVKLLEEQSELTHFWRPSWEDASGSYIADAWRSTVEECRDMISAAQTTARDLRISAETGSASRCSADYNRLIEILNLRDAARRGSGTSTVVAALILAAGFVDDPRGCAVTAARAVGTDTDTVASMALAMVGAGKGAPDLPQVLDAPYMASEAARLAAIALGGPTVAFAYPDLLHWTPPRSQLDAVGIAGGQPALAGLGWLTPDEQSETTFSKGAAWAWTKSDFGCSFLVKRRSQLEPLPRGNWPTPRRPHLHPPANDGASQPTGEARFHETGDMTAATVGHRTTGSGNLPTSQGDGPGFGDQSPGHISIDVDRVLGWVEYRGFSEQAIGYAVRRLGEVGSLEQMIAFTVALRNKLAHR